MSRPAAFSLRRAMAMLIKETLQIRRDPATILMAVMIPIVQILLFGSAINTNPRNLPAALVIGDSSREVRDIVTALGNTGYFALTPYESDAAASRALARGEVLYIVNIPPGFTRQLIRGEAPQILIDADATDQVTIAAGTAALPALQARALSRDLAIPVAGSTGSGNFSFTLHARYNPEQITAYTIVPGLIGVVLSFSTLVLTTIAITRERETGTMETLLSLPLQPLEVMFGKIVPYIGLGYVQVAVTLITATLVFGVPVAGSLILLLATTGLFIASNLALGFLLSTIAETQMQAQQMAMFMLLPSFLLSGFAFPFQGMPQWARIAGEMIPMTHMNRICRGIMLKGLGFSDIMAEILALLVFAILTGVLARQFYRTTLD